MAREASASALPTIEAVRQMSEQLGRQLLALTLGSSVTDVDRWLRGDMKPKPDTERRIQDAFKVFQWVSAVESPKTTRAWWMGMQEELDGLSPAEGIAAGESREVMAAAQAFVEGN